MILSDRDRRLFAAAGLTNRATGVPILTHTEGGLGGMEQITTLLAHGIDPASIALSHTDKIADAAYHRDMLETGVYLCYDQGIRDPEQTFDLVEAMASHGFGGRILLGTDGARRSLWSTLGGSPGLASLYSNGVNRFGSAFATEIFVANPARYLSLAA